LTAPYRGARFPADVTGRPCHSPGHLTDVSAADLTAVLTQHPSWALLRGRPGRRPARDGGIRPPLEEGRPVERIDMHRLQDLVRLHRLGTGVRLAPAPGQAGHPVTTGQRRTGAPRCCGASSRAI